MHGRMHVAGRLSLRGCRGLVYRPCVLRSYHIITKPEPEPIWACLSKVVTEPPFAKFDETVTLQLHVTLDPRKPNQNLKQTVQLPFGTGKKVSILVLTEDEAQKKEAVELGARAPEEPLLEALQNVTENDDFSIFNDVDRIICKPGDMR